MNILVLNPPYFKMYSRASRSPAVTKSSTLYYPIYLCYATGLLDEAGFNVKLIDGPAMGYDIEDIIKIAKEFKPDLAALDTTTPSIYNDIKLAEAIKDACNPYTVMVGTHVSALPQESLELSDKIDAIARREYDYTILGLARLINDQNSKDMNLYKQLKKIKGLSFRTNGTIMHNIERPYIKNLDELPFVSSVYKRHLSQCLDSYFYGANLHPVIPILSGRGCPHQCIYCVYPQTMTGNTYRYRSIENVVDELGYIKVEFPHVKEVFLEDDTLTVNAKRAEALAEEIRHRGLKIKWSTNSRADVNYHTLKGLKDAGCRLLCVGFESGDQDVLNGINKNLRVERIYQFMKDAKKAGILVHGCFMVGNPGESRETMRKTLEMAKKINPDTAQFFPIMVYPGTKAYKWSEENGFLKTRDFSRWLTREGLHNCVVERPGLTSQDLVDFCNMARKEFYLRPTYFLSKVKQIFLSPNEFGRIKRAARTLMKYLLKVSFAR